ncbi:hypothetical protein MY10362_004906 [Beauveria mimosiformis]
MADSAIQGGRRTGVSGQHKLADHHTSASDQCLSAARRHDLFVGHHSTPRIQQHDEQAAQSHITFESAMAAKLSRPEPVLSSSTGSWPSDSSRSRNYHVALSRGNYCDSICTLAHILEPRQADSADAGSQSTSSNGSQPGAAEGQRPRDITDSHAPRSTIICMGWPSPSTFSRC